MTQINLVQIKQTFSNTMHGTRKAKYDKKKL